MMQNDNDSSFLNFNLLCTIESTIDCVLLIHYVENNRWLNKAVTSYTAKDTDTIMFPWQQWSGPATTMDSMGAKIRFGQTLARWVLTAKHEWLSDWEARFRRHFVFGNLPLKQHWMIFGHWGVKRDSKTNSVKHSPDGSQFKGKKQTKNCIQSQWKDVRRQRELRPRCIHVS